MFSTLKNRTLLKIYCIPLFVMITENMLGAITIPFALYLKADILQINLITTIAATMQLALEIPFGILSDRLGRKPMLIYTRALIIGGTIIRVFATEPNHLLLASLLGGFSGGDFFPLILSMVGDTAEPRERQEAISTMFIFSSVGMLVGPTIASLLLIFPQITLRNIHQIVLMGQIATVIYFVTQVSETKPKTTKNEKVDYRLVTSLIRQTSFQGLMTMTFFLWFYRAVLGTYLQVYAKVNLNLSDAEVASFSVYRNLATMLSRLISATLLVRVPFRPALVSFLVLGGVTGLSSPFANSYTSIVLIEFFSGMGYGASRIMQDTLAANSATPENRGVANSLIQLSSSSGNLTKILTTPIVAIYGFVPVFVLAGICGLISSVPPLLNKVGSIEREGREKS